MLVEGQYGRENTAKDILFSTIEAIEKRMVQVGVFNLYAESLEKEVQTGQILVSLRDSSLASFAHSVFGAPPYQGNTSNFVYPVFTSLSGNKSDRYIDRVFRLNTTSASGCTVTNHFEMQSTHTFSVSEREKIRKMLYEYSIDPSTHEHELFVQGNGDNVQYLRVIVPK